MHKHNLENSFIYTLSEKFRKLPDFKGKNRLAELIFKNILNKRNPVSFTAFLNLHYTIPNTIESVGKQLFINGEYERKTQKTIKSCLSDASSVFLDVGANIGSISLPIAKTTKAQVHSFEPSKLSFSYLEKNTKDNKIENIKLNNVAVHSIDGSQMQFFESEEKYGNSSLSATYSKQPHYTVNSVSLDAYCNRNNIPKITVLKVDVQGYEIEVLKGATELLKNKSIGTIIFEMESWAEKQAGYNAGASQQFLLDNGYELFTMEEVKLNKVYTDGSHMFIAKPSK